MSRQRYRSSLASLAFLTLLAPSPGPGQLLPVPPEDTEPAAEENLETAEEATPFEPLEDVEPDANLAERLDAIYANVGDLEDIRAEVGEGVVRLRGTVASASAREKAEAIAARQDGIVAVDNRIEIARDLGRRLAPVREKLAERAFQLLALLPLVGIAVVLLGLFWFLARWIGNRDPLYRHVSENRFVRDLAAQVVSTVVFVLGILLVLEILDATALVGAVLGTAGVIGLALGFAFKDLVENYIASVLLSIRQPFAPGDHVVVGDREGKVVRLTSRATVLMTLDGNHLRIPNAEVFKGTVLNYSTNPRRRFQFRVGVGVEEGLDRVRQIALDELAAIEGVLDEPEPMVLIDQLGDSTVALVLFGWVDQRQASFVKVQSEAIRRIKERFDAEGVSMPEPTYRIQWLGGAAPEPGVELPPRAESSRPEPSEAAVADIAPETHLDEEIADERAREEDLLSSDGPQE